MTWCILESKSAALVTAVFVDFLFAAGSNSSHREAPCEEFSPGAVAIIAVWKSAPMLSPVVDVDHNTAWTGVDIADQHAMTCAVC